MARTRKYTEIVEDGDIVAVLKESTPEIVIVTEQVPAQNNVNVLSRYYDRLFSNGVLVHLKIARWGMSARLSENDLDIEKVPDIIRLGKKMLIRPTIFNQFSQKEQQARNYLKRNSLSFHIAQAHFVGLAA